MIRKVLGTYKECKKVIKASDKLGDAGYDSFHLEQIDKFSEIEHYVEDGGRAVKIQFLPREDYEIAELIEKSDLFLLTLERDNAVHTKKKANHDAFERAMKTLS